MNLTKNFTLEEMIFSATAKRLKIPNLPDQEQIENLNVLCKKLLQPLRDGCGKPLYISSGYRCPALNRVVNGSPASDHQYGRAADIATDNPMALFAWVCRLNLSYDQAILHKDFVHLSYRDEKRNRKMVILGI